MGLGAMALHAQTKQGVNATMQRNPSQLQQQSSFSIQAPPTTTQTISGYYQEGFEGTTFAPAGWRVENVAGPSYTWARSTAQAHVSTASAFIRYDTGGGQDWLIAPRYLVTASTDSLVFWMRMAFTGYPPDSLCIKISTTDSLTSSFGNNTLLKLQEGTNYPTNTTTWYRYAVSLQNYVGQQVYIAFKHYNVDGDGLYIDDVAIGTVPTTEVGTTAMISPAANVSQGSIVPQGSFYNYGSAAQTFDVTTTITPGGYTGTTSVTLASGASGNASFPAWAATPGTYTVKMFTDLAGDVNRTNDTITRTVTVLNAFVEYGWDAMTALPAGRWATAPVFVKPCLSSTDTGFVYLITGADATFANTTLNTRYNTVTGTYTNLAPIPQSRTQVTPLHVNGKIYVIGGYGGSFSPVTTNSIYDIATDTWSTGAAMPTAVGDYAAGTYNDSLIYFVGGYNGTGDVNTVQIYDTYTNTWTTGTPKTGTSVAGCRMGIANGNIVLVGGYSQTLAATQSASYLGLISPSNPATISWVSLPAYPGGTTGRQGGGVAFEENGMVYFAAGDPTGQGTQVLNSVYGYNTILGQWEVGPNALVGMSNISGLAGAVHNDSLYIVTMGGYDGAAVVTQNSWLNIGPAAPLPMLQNDTAICAGSTIQLNGYNALTYSWSPAASLDNATIANPTSSATSTTTYTVTMTKAYGCPETDSVMLTVNPLPTVVASVTSDTICAGTAIVFSGNGASSYAWTGGVTNAVAYVPATTGTYTVTGTDANGCINTDTITVTVNALPAVVANASATAVCGGDSVTLSGSGATTYTWTGSVTDNVMFAPAVTDTYIVTGTDGNGCMNTDTITVTVNMDPVVIANSTDSAICEGSSVTLTGGGASTYTWTGSVTDNVAFTPVATDTYIVTGTDTNGCMGMDSVTVIVNALPVVTGNSSAPAVCAGDSITLSGSGAATYTWTGGVTDNVAFVPAASGTYTVTGTDANGCQNTDEVTITVNALPTVTAAIAATTICVDDANLALTGGLPAGGTWSGTGVTGSSFDPSVPGAGTSVTTYTFTDATGCTASAMDSIVVDLCVGIDGVMSANGIVIYPNPNSGMFTIQLSAAPVSPVMVEMMNELGQVVDAFTMTSTTKQVDISQLESGVYFVRTISGNTVTVHRVVKQ